MRSGRFRGLVLAGAFVFLAASGIRANPLHDPKRLLNGATVSLTPLFQWWTNRAGTRPLGAWVRVTGRIVGTNASGWILEAHPEHTAASPVTEAENGRILLRHPPLSDLAEFERLSAQLKALNQQHGAIAAQQNAAQRQESAVSKEQSQYRKYGLRNRSLAREDRVLKASESQTKAELKPVDQQIAELKKQLGAYPNPDHYEVDCFALDTGQQLDRLSVYDHGSALR
jgi:hypothetical protein